MLYRSSVVAVALVLCARVADAQIVNVQGQLAKPPPRDGVTGQLELKLDWHEGNNSLFDAGGSAAVVLRRGRVLGLVLARGQYANARDGLAIARRSFEHVRARVTLDERWKWEAFAQHEWDAFRRLSVRGVAGTGPALQIVESEPFSLLAGLAYLFELEQRDRRAGTIDAGLRTIAHRASAYLTGSERLGEGVSFVQTVYVQPRLDDASDLRLLAEVSVITKLSKRLALTNGLTATYDRTPPDTIRRSDVALKVGLLLTL